MLSMDFFRQYLSDLYEQINLLHKLIVENTQSAPGESKGNNLNVLINVNTTAKCYFSSPLGTAA